MKFSSVLLLSVLIRYLFFSDSRSPQYFPGHNLTFMIEIVAVSNIYTNLSKFLRYGWMLAAKFSTPLVCAPEFSYL